MRKKHKTQEKTHNLSKNLKVWEAFSAPEVPSGVIKKAWLNNLSLLGPLTNPCISVCHEGPCVSSKNPSRIRNLEEGLAARNKNENHIVLKSFICPSGKSTILE